MSSSKSTTTKSSTYPEPAIGAPPISTVSFSSSTSTSLYPPEYDTIIVPETGLPLSQLNLYDVLFIVGEYYMKETNHTVGLNHLSYIDDRLLDAVVKYQRSNGRTRLHLAARKRDVARVERLLACGSDPNAKLDVIFWTPLLVLALPDDHGQFDSPYYTYPSSKTVPTGIGENELERKMDLQRREALIAEALIKRGANINTTTSQKESVITLASWQNKLPLVKTLLKYGANPDLKSNTKECGLIYAATGSHTEIAELLLDYGADPNSMNNGGANPLIAATDRNLISLAKKLLEKNADPNVLTIQNRDSPLIFAAWKNRIEILRLLIAAGADINHRNNSHSSPYDYGMRHGNEDVVVELINAGLDLEMVDTIGNTVLLAAIEKGYGKVIDAALAKGANINAKTAITGNTALMVACINGNTKAFFTLIDWDKQQREKQQKNANDSEPNRTEGTKNTKNTSDNGTDGDVTSSDDSSRASSNNSSSAHRSYQALDLNAVNSRGKTALMLAIQGNKNTSAPTLIATTLISCGCDTKIRCERGYDAMYYAKTEKLTAVTQLLEDAAQRK